MMWGRNITKKILDPEFYDLGPRILCYLSIEPDMQSTTLQESLRLIVEAGRTWITCLRYGLGKKLKYQLGVVHKLRLQDEVGRWSKNVNFLSKIIP